MTYEDDNIFARVLRREIPADVVYEDDHCLAFRDLAPQAPTHILLIPRAKIAKLGDVESGDREALGHLMWAAAEVARREDLGDFRVVVNSGAGAQQTVFHLHVHLLAGRDFSWPPG